jgi:hypothetical protein
MRMDKMWNWVHAVSELELNQVCLSDFLRAL